MIKVTSIRYRTICHFRLFRLIARYSGHVKVAGVVAAVVAAVAVVNLALDTVRGFFISWRVADLAVEVSILNLPASIMEIALEVVRIFGQGTTASRGRSIKSNPQMGMVSRRNRRKSKCCEAIGTARLRRLNDSPGCTRLRVLRVVTLVITETSQEMVSAPRSEQMNHTH